MFAKIVAEMQRIVKEDVWLCQTVVSDVRALRLMRVPKGVVLSFK